MKTIESIQHNGTSLTVLIEEKETGKAFCSYFVNGYEVTDWGKIKSLYQHLFTALVTEMCDYLNLTKWSY